MEMQIVNKNDIPYKPEWAKKLRQQVKNFQNGNNVIKLTLKKNENPNGLETAWRKLCNREYKKVPHVKILKHVLGYTVWLWMDS